MAVFVYVRCDRDGIRARTLGKVDGLILEQVGRCSSEHENQELVDPTLELEGWRA